MLNVFIMHKYLWANVFDFANAAFDRWIVCSAQSAQPTSKNQHVHIVNSRESLYNGHIVKTIFRILFECENV